MRKIAIVRAINYLPFGGVLKSLAHTPNLVVDRTTEFKRKIIDLLVSEGVLKLMVFDLEVRQLRKIIV